MKKVSFLKHDLEIHTSYVEGAHKPGDPVPVALVHTALQDWQRRLSGLMSGLSAEDHVNLTAPKTAWDHVCIGAQTFSAAQFLSAEKHSPAPRTHAGVSSSLYHRQRDTPFIDPQKRLILRPPVEAGYVPAAVSPAFNAKARAAR